MLPRRSSSPGSAAWETTNGAVRLTSSCFCQLLRRGEVREVAGVVVSRCHVDADDLGALGDEQLGGGLPDA
jgi:hypothetical protein